MSDGVFCNHPDCLAYMDDDNAGQNNRCHNCRQPRCGQHLYHRRDKPYPLCTVCLEELTQQAIKARSQ